MKRLMLFLLCIFQLIASAQEFSEKKTADPDIINILNKIESDSLKSYMLKLQDFGTRHTLNPNRKEVANWIKSKFESFGYTDVILDSFLYIHYMDTSLKAMQYNVVASFSGGHLPAQYLILGSHHDCTSSPISSAPGADDNASGVAGTLEIARVIRENYSPGYTIRFITFAAEEIGLLGSESYADSAFKENLDIKLMVNLDMIGNQSGINNWEVTIYDLPNPQWVIDLAHDVADDYTSLSYYDDYLGAFSDQQPFCDRGYTAIMLSESEFSPFYHSIHDSVSHINIEYCRENVKLACGILLSKDAESIGIVENIDELNFSVFPNPSTGVFQITYNGKSNVIIEVIDVMGKEIIRFDNINFQGNKVLDMKEFSKGIYFVRLINNDIFTTQKIIIQ